MSGCIVVVGALYRDTDPRLEGRRKVRVWAICDDGRIAIEDQRTGRITRISPVRFPVAFVRENE